MKFNELLEVTKGIDFPQYGMTISLGKPADCVGSMSCYQDGDEWVIVEVDERQQAYEVRGNEEDIVERMYSRIKILMGGNL